MCEPIGIRRILDGEDRFEDKSPLPKGTRCSYTDCSRGIGGPSPVHFEDEKVGSRDPKSFHFYRAHVGNTLLIRMNMEVQLLLSDDLRLVSRLRRFGERFCIEVQSLSHLYAITSFYTRSEYSP